MQVAKQDVLNTRNQLPDNADREEIMCRLYVLDKIRKGQKDVAHNRVTDAGDLKREIDQR